MVGAQTREAAGGMTEGQLLEIFLNGDWQDMVTWCDYDWKGMVINNSNVLSYKTEWICIV